MDHETALRRIADEHGTFLRRDVLALGLDDATIRRALRARRWARVRHGAYQFTEIWAAASPEERHVMTARAVLRVGGVRLALSHVTAAAVHGLDLWDLPLDLVHVTRLDGGAGRTDAGVKHHEGLCLDADLVRVGGTLATTPVRAALESALLGGVERGLVVVDAGLRRGLFTPGQLAAQHALMERWPGSQPLHLVTRLADGGSGSVGESRTRYLCWSQGLPMPRLQFEVYGGGRLVGITDFAWPEHGLLGEFDGRVKYGRLLRPGETAGDAVFREKRREDELRRVTGWRMVRLTWDDLGQRRRTAEMIRAMLAPAA